MRYLSVRTYCIALKNCVMFISDYCRGFLISACKDFTLVIIIVVAEEADLEVGTDGFEFVRL